MPDIDEKYDQAVNLLIEYDRQRTSELTEGKFEVVHPTFDVTAPLPLEPGTTLEPFSRAGLERKFLQLVGRSELTVVERRSLANQSDFLAALEKTFRYRHQTRLQLFTRGTSRAHGHGQTAGFKKFVLKRLPTMED